MLTLQPLAWPAAPPAAPSAVPTEAPTVAPPPGKEQIPSSGLTETSSVSLTLIDIVATDKKGRPLRGLKKDDFLLFLNSIVWPIYSVDDLCTCQDTKSAPAPAPAPATVHAAPPPAADGAQASGSAASAQGSQASPGTDGEAKPQAGGESGAVPQAMDSSAADGAGGQRAGTGSGTGIAASGALAAGAAGTSANTGSADSGVTGPDPIHFVLYLDFAELQVSSRARALEAARKWIQQTKRPADEAMVAAYGPGAGLVELSKFTTANQVLLAAIDKAAVDPKFQTTFPDNVRSRHDECVRALADPWVCKGADACPVCENYARDEYQAGLYSMRALKAFVSDLQSTPGRKALIYFHENGLVFPTRLYPSTDDFRVGDHLKLMDQVGAEASLSRTAIYPAYTGDRLAAQHGSVEEELADGALNLGSNLADLTGGKYNRDLLDLGKLLDSAGDRCPCIYRIAIEAPKHPTSTVYEVRVQVGNLVMPYNQRVQFLDEQSRWLKKAVAVLRHPEQAGELPVGAAIVPRGSTGGLWAVDVEVGMSLDSVEMIPAAGGWQGSWEAGAFFASADGTPSWEMLGVSNIHRESGGKSHSAVIHEHSFKGLAPGQWRLAAFVRDKTAGVFGGAEASIELPEPGKDAAIGPLIQRGRLQRLVVPLPLNQKKSNADSRSSHLETGPVPLAQNRAFVGEPLEAVTWVCPQGPPPKIEDLQRYLSSNGKPIFRLEPATLVPSGACLQVTDRLPTGELGPGIYTYNLRWRRSDGKPPVMASREFVLIQPAPAPRPPPPGPSPTAAPSDASPATAPPAPAAPAPVAPAATAPP